MAFHGFYTALFPLVLCKLCGPTMLCRGTPRSKLNGESLKFFFLLLNCFIFLEHCIQYPSHPHLSVFCYVFEETLLCLIIDFSFCFTMWIFWILYLQLKEHAHGHYLGLVLWSLTLNTILTYVHAKKVRLMFIMLLIDVKSICESLKVIVETLELFVMACASWSIESWMIILKAIDCTRSTWQIHSKNVVFNGFNVALKWKSVSWILIIMPCTEIRHSFSRNLAFENDFYNIWRYYMFVHQLIMYIK